MYDKFGRLHHDQRYRNSIHTARGILLDTVEIDFLEPVNPSNQEKIRKSMVEVFSESVIEWIEWPGDSRCTIGLIMDYYNLAKLKGVLSKYNIKINEVKPSYSARLSK